MIKCHLSRIMGEKRLRVIDVMRATGLNRGTINRLYYETAERVELKALETLCRHLDCGVGDLLELVDPKVTGVPKY